MQDDFPNDQLFCVVTTPAREMNEEMDDARITEMTIFLTTGLQRMRGNDSQFAVEIFAF